MHTSSFTASTFFFYWNLSKVILYLAESNMIKSLYEVVPWHRLVFYDKKKKFTKKKWHKLSRLGNVFNPNYSGLETKLPCMHKCKTWRLGYTTWKLEINAKVITLFTWSMFWAIFKTLRKLLQAFTCVSGSFISFYTLWNVDTVSKTTIFVMFLPFLSVDVN